MKPNKSKTEIASFRLAPLAHATLYRRADEAGISTRAWLESAILENKTRIVAKQKPHPELRPLLYQVNKAGNNINQLAHHFNAMKMENKITGDEYHTALRKLEGIERALMAAVDYAR